MEKKIIDFDQREWLKPPVAPAADMGLLDLGDNSRDIIPKALYCRF